MRGIFHDEMSSGTFYKHHNKQKANKGGIQFWQRDLVLGKQPIIRMGLYGGYALDGGGDQLNGLLTCFLPTCLALRELELQHINGVNDEIMNNRIATKASETIKAKLIDAGGRAMIPLYSGELREIIACSNGKEFLCPKLIPYPYTVFDAIVDLLLKSPGYRARKGSARSHRLGEPGCDEATVTGTVLAFMGKKPGESGLDPVFLLAAVLEWAGIATNGRGEIYLNAGFSKNTFFRNT